MEQVSMTFRFHDNRNNLFSDVSNICIVAIDININNYNSLITKSRLSKILNYEQNIIEPSSKKYKRDKVKRRME